MGVDAILMSEIFGFDSAVDIQTKRELIELRGLQLKRFAAAELSIEETSRFNELYEKLKNIDFAEPLYVEKPVKLTRVIRSKLTTYSGAN